MLNTEDVSTENATVLELMLETASNAEVGDQEIKKIYNWDNSPVPCAFWLLWVTSIQPLKEMAATLKTENYL